MLTNPITPKPTKGFIAAPKLLTVNPVIKESVNPISKISNKETIIVSPATLSNLLISLFLLFTGILNV